MEIGVNLCQWRGAIDSFYSRYVSAPSPHSAPASNFILDSYYPGPACTFRPTDRVKESWRRWKEFKAQRHLQADAHMTRWWITKTAVFLTLTFPFISYTISCLLTYSYLDHGTFIKTSCSSDLHPGPLSKVIFCTKCPKVKEQEKLEKSSHSGTFSCSLCPKMFDKISTYKRHVNKIHKNFHGGIFCSICGKTFNRIQNCNVHEEMCHGENRTKVKCQYCEKGFSSKSAKQLHVKKKHQTELRKYL